jgi:hypothetical protein
VEYAPCSIRPEDIMNRLLGFASLGTALLALAVALWGPREPVAAATSTDTRPAASSPEVQALARRVQALEDTTVSLSRRLMALEGRPAGAPGASEGTPAASAPALAAEVEQLRAEVRGLLAGEALQSEGGREYLKDAVRSAQEELRAEQRQARQQEWQQAQAQVQAQRSERLRQFITEARLNYTQEQALTQRLQAEDARRQALFEEVRAGGKSPRDVRQELRALRNETDQEMQKLLSAEQQTKYEEMRREERQQGRPRGQRAGDGPQ